VYAWLFVWNKPEQNIKKSPAIAITANNLFLNYSSDEKNANLKFIDKIIEVTGEVNEVTKNNEGLDVVLMKTDDPMFGVNCTMEEKNTAIKSGTTVTLKGICTGYLTDVVLIRCYLIINK
jgi:hypothetical protein